MTRTPARPERLEPRPRGLARKITLAFTVVGALCAFATAARAGSANPLPLESDKDISSFVERLRDYAGASRVRWIVAGRTEADARATLARIEAALPPSDQYLAARLTAESLDQAGLPPEGPAQRAFVTPQFGSSGAQACSWQLWLTDPRLPSPNEDAVTVPLAPNDRLPVGPGATFRVGHSGLLQTRLYAFDETHPGAIRDLATAPDVNVPVSMDEGGETIFLATARETAPFLESLRTALSSSEGRRRDLGAQFALRGKLLGKGRGIGANIQNVSPDMIAVKGGDPVVASNHSDAGASPLMETCVYALTPAH